MLVPYVRVNDIEYFPAGMILCYHWLNQRKCIMHLKLAMS